MDGPRDIILSKIEKSKYHIISLTVGSKKKDTGEFIYKIETDSQA